MIHRSCAPSLLSLSLSLSSLFCTCVNT
jgi:hypothetical protein